MDSLVLYCIFSINKLLSSKSNPSGLKALQTNDDTKDHVMPSLILNKHLSKISQTWAEELTKQDNISSNEEDTSNDVVYCGWTSTNTNGIPEFKDCVEKWKNVIKHSYDDNQHKVKCASFSQIDWKDIKEIGMGVSQSKTGSINLVTNYVPANFVQDDQLNEDFHFNSTELSNINKFTSVLRKSYEIKHIEILRKIRDYLKFSLKFSLAKETPIQDKETRQGGPLVTGEFKNDFMAAHNEYRMLHKAPLLILDDTISNYAQEWARFLAEENDGNIERRNQTEYGENIYFAWTPDQGFVLDGRTPVENWYSEISNFTFGQEPDGNNQIEQFTQLVWVATKQVGVGMAKSFDQFTTVVVANYYPQGNVEGEFATNVLPADRSFGRSIG